MSSNVDERTIMEIYFPPFQAAVDAGVGAIMCGYNKVNNVWACENNQTLGLLKAGTKPTGTHGSSTTSSPCPPSSSAPDVDGDANGGGGGCGGNSTAALWNRTGGFKGFVMSDWGATHSTAASDHPPIYPICILLFFFGVNERTLLRQRSPSVPSRIGSKL